MIVILGLWMVLRFVLALAAFGLLLVGVGLLIGFVSIDPPVAWWKPFLAGWVVGFVGMIGDGLVGMLDG